MIENDLRIIILLRYKIKITIFEKIWLKWLERSYPSFNGSLDIQNELLNKKYLEDVSGWDCKYDEEKGEFITRPNNIPLILKTTELGEKAIYSKELKSENTEYFLDKTLVRLGAIIGGGYAIISFFIDFFRYIKNNFFQH